MKLQLHVVLDYNYIPEIFGDNDGFPRNTPIKKQDSYTWDDITNYINRASNLADTHMKQAFVPCLYDSRTEQVTSPVLPPVYCAKVAAHIKATLESMSLPLTYSQDLQDNGNRVEGMCWYVLRAFASED